MEQKHFRGDHTLITVILSGKATWTILSSLASDEEYVAPTEHFDKEGDAIARWHDKCRAFEFIGFDKVDTGI